MWIHPKEGKLMGNVPAKIFETVKIQCGIMMYNGDIEWAIKL